MNSVNFKTRKDVFLQVQNVNESEKLRHISNFILSEYKHEARRFTIGTMHKRILKQVASDYRCQLYAYSDLPCVLTALALLSRLWHGSSPSSLQMESVPDDLMHELDQNIRNFLRSVKSKLNQYNRHVGRLLSDPWLNEPFKLPPRFSTDKENLVKNSGGRPKTADFGQLSASGQRKRTQQIRTDFTTDELEFAAKSKKRLETRASDKPADTSSTTTSNDFIPFNAEEMAAIIQICKLTKASYLFLRQALKSHGADVFPNYEKIWKGKNVFYPDDQDMTVSQSEAVIPVQALFDLTATRIVKTHSEVFESSPEDKSVTMLWKWGFDGSSGHVEYSQVSSTPDLEEKNIILVGAVPLQIYTKTNTGNSTV
ncbi:hypothetical protein FOCC_FOCC014943 [Frankliniella occidentalis]|nr:hypothetical protein FOCC_FOCC014943 [Frankliniella occidentalis]